MASGSFAQPSIKSGKRLSFCAKSAQRRAKAFSACSESLDSIGDCCFERRFAKPVYGLQPVPRVRIPLSPLSSVAGCRKHAIFGHFHFRGVPGSSLLWRYLWRFVAWDHSAGELLSWRAPQHRFVLVESKGINAARSGISVILSKDSVNARVSVQTARPHECWRPRPTPKSPSALRVC